MKVRVTSAAISALLLLSVSTSARAQEDIGFRPAEEYDTGGKPFEMAIIDELLTTLDELLNRPEVKEDFAQNSRIHLWRFMNRLANGILEPDHDRKIAAYFDRLKETRPEHSDWIDSWMWQIEHLMIGKEAPDIVGRDMHGEEFRLSDYRGNIVVLVFTGHWCGPCRGEYPYQRLLLEVMADEPVVLLGVNSDDDREEALQAKKDEGLEYRSWWAGWDNPEGDPRRGAIPSRWNVIGWPTIYIIDADGIIRFKDTRQEKMITAVKELLYGG